ncbi:hypothetical protein V7056_06060 [Bacillus sp. JJ664]
METAINGTKLEVKFNKAVAAGSLYDATTGVIDANSLKIVNTSGAAPVTAGLLKGSLSEDGKTLTVTVSGGAEFFAGTYTVDVLKDAVKLKDNASAYVEAFKGFVTVSDTTAPTVTGVDYSGASATVKFSEALANEGTISLNGVVLVEGTDYATFTAGGSSVTIFNVEAGKVSNLEIVGAKDVKGNIANPLSVQLNRTADTTKPTVQVTVQGTKATFKFSEQLKDLDPTAATDYATVTLGDGSTFKLTATEKDATDPTVFVKDIAVAGDFLNTTIKVDTFKDISDNTGDAVTTSVSLVKDKTAPKFVSVITKDDKLIVKFDEDVNPAAIAKADISVKYVDSEGVLHPTAVLDVLDDVIADGYDANGNGSISGDEANYLVFNLTNDNNTVTTADDVASTYVSNGKLKAGTYTVTLAAGKIADKAAVANVTTAPITFTTTVTSTVASQKVVTAVATQVALTPGQLQVVYNKDMGASALTAANYTLGGVALPAGTTLNFVGNKKTVVITLPTNTITATGDRTLVINSNVKDVDGNVLADGEGAELIAGVLENVAAVASKVSLVDSQNLLVDLSEKVSLPAGAVTGVTVKVNGNAITLDATTPFALDATGTKLTIKGSATAFKLTDVITVEFASANIKDAAGNAVKDVVLTK